MTGDDKPVLPIAIGLLVSISYQHVSHFLFISSCLSVCLSWLELHPLPLLSKWQIGFFPYVPMVTLVLICSEIENKSPTTCICIYIPHEAMLWYLYVYIKSK